MLHVPITEMKAHLSDLVHQVELGQTIAITKHGQEVARLTPSPTKKRKDRDIVAEFSALREGLQPVPIEDIISSIHEGHRY